MARLEGRQCPEGRGPGQCGVQGEAPGGLRGETIHRKLRPARTGPVLAPRSPLTSCLRARLGEGPGSAQLPPRPAPESCLIGAAGHSSMLPLVFPESHTGHSRGLFLQEPASWSGPQAAADSCRQPGPGASASASASADRMPPALCPRDKGRSGQEGPRPHLQRRIFPLQTAVAARERGLFIPGFSWAFRNSVFLPDCPLALGVPLSLPSSEALLPTLPARRQRPPEFPRLLL